MNVSDDELRSLVRESIARVKGGRTSADEGPTMTSTISHHSHHRFALVRGGDGDGACLIEPSVRCSHCGYCQSYGH